MWTVDKEEADAAGLRRLILRSPGDPGFEAAWKLLQKSFPADQLRSLEGQQRILAKSEYAFCAVLTSDSRLAGVLGYWQFDHLRFIEHLAVEPELRGRGIGTAIVRHLFSSPARCTVLETDPPENGEAALRKIRWYEFLGFEMTPYAYHQPAYAAEKRPVEMKLMSLPALLSPVEFENLVRLLHRLVYGVPDLSLLSIR